MVTERLLAFIERVERLVDERSEVQAQIKEVLDEAAGEGFDKAMIRQVVRLRSKMDAAERDEWLTTLDTYLKAIV